MTRDDIMRLAEESELWNVITQHSCEYGDGLPTLDRYPELERFAALVAYEEREACAMACERPEPVGKSELRHRTHRECAAAIRKRGERP
jgi:hypothetical protein